MTSAEQGFMDKCAQHGVKPTVLLKEAGIIDDIKEQWESIDPDTRNYLVGSLGGALTGGLGGAAIDGGSGALAGALGGAALGTGGAALYNAHNQSRSDNDRIEEAQRRLHDNDALLDYYEQNYVQRPEEIEEELQEDPSRFYDYVAGAVPGAGHTILGASRGGIGGALSGAAGSLSGAVGGGALGGVLGSLTGAGAGAGLAALANMVTKGKGGSMLSKTIGGIGGATAGAPLGALLGGYVGSAEGGRLATLPDKEAMAKEAANPWGTLRANGLDSLLDILRLKQLREGFGSFKDTWATKARTHHNQNLTPANALSPISSGREADYKHIYKGLEEALGEGAAKEMLMGGAKGGALYGGTTLAGLTGLNSLLGEEAPAPRYHN